MLGIEYVNGEHDCNVLSMNTLNIHDANCDCTMHEENVSYKHVDFCGVHRVRKYIPKREDRFCKKHNYLETKKLQHRLDDCAERCNFFAILVNFAMNLVI